MKKLLRVPANDRLWLMAALREALNGGPAILPLGESAPVVAAEIAEDTALVIHTSGSSGVAKSVALTADALKASAHATNEALGGAGQWLVMLPCYLISGVQMLTRSIVSETEPVFYDGRLNPEKFLTQAKKLSHDRRYVSLVPVQLATLMEAARQDARLADALRRFDAILVGGQATPMKLRQEAHEMRLNLVRTYGMTETAGGVVYDGVEIGDTRVRIREGEVQLSGPTLASEYLGNAELTAKKFLTENGVRWFLTGDAGELLGGMLQITGRIDRVIVSGGVNVSLDLVEERVLRATDFKEVVALGVPDEKWGARLVLAVPVVLAVPASTPDVAFEVTQTAANALSKQELLVHLGAALQNMGKAALPKDIIFLEELPRLSGGKPDYAAVRKLVLEKLETAKLETSKEPQ